MSLPETETPSFTSPQRRCHLLLQFYLPGHRVTVDLLSQINGIDRQSAWQDITEVRREIQRYHHLELKEDISGGWRLHGDELDKRLCLLHWLRRALRLSPGFVQQQFAPTLRQHLRQQQVETALWDERNLQALIQHCGHQLRRDYAGRDGQFLQLLLQYCLIAADEVVFSSQQARWLASKAEWSVGSTILQHWHRRCRQPRQQSEATFITLLFSLIHAPALEKISHPSEHRLQQAIVALIARFQQLSGMHFSDESGLQAQLFTHLAQALDRTLFAVGIDDSLAEEMVSLYPRLLRTTREALVPFETEFAIAFPDEELGLIAVIFGAWLMQENALQEKQVLLLIDRNAALEKQVEQQVRELTLLPLNIKYLDVDTWQREGAPKGIALVVTPYATALPLYSPPLIHAELPLSAYQQQCIRTLLEA